MAALHLADSSSARAENGGKTGIFIQNKQKQASQTNPQALQWHDKYQFDPESAASVRRCLTGSVGPINSKVLCAKNRCCHKKQSGVKRQQYQPSSSRNTCKFKRLSMRFVTFRVKTNDKEAAAS
ncbi:hypothetical protein [Chlorobaculum limnaeum]|uniref:hypothetical protein n=1 Tax=Chlorobaculum limnaeum TaxID=274537 RepID=UPI0012EE486D|nr:hypothetical protein [Chlorobaculum limnaeum]